METVLYSDAPLGSFRLSSSCQPHQPSLELHDDPCLLTIETSLQPLPAVPSTPTGASQCHADNVSTCTCTTASGNQSPSRQPHEDQLGDHEDHRDSDNQHAAANSDEEHPFRETTSDHNRTTVDDINNNHHHTTKSYAMIPPEVAAHLVVKTEVRVEHTLAKAAFLQEAASQRRMAQLTTYRIVDDDQSDGDHHDIKGDDNDKNNDIVINTLSDAQLSLLSSDDAETVREEVCCDDVDLLATEPTPTVRVGDLIAVGGFATVHHVTLSDVGSKGNYVIKHLSPRLATPPMTAHEKEQLQQFYEQYTKQQQNKNSKNRHNSHRRTFTKLDKDHPYKKLFLGAKDLVLEAHVLAALSPHDHIVQCRGWSGLNQQGLPAYETTLRTDAFFIILENLTGGTLADKLRHWRLEQWQLQKDREVRQLRTKMWGRIQRFWRKPSSDRDHHHRHHHHASYDFSSSLTTDDDDGVELCLKTKNKHGGDDDHHSCSKKLKELKEKVERQLFFQERLHFAVDLADALAHMHQHRIMHRDLKPANVGFDADGQLKLFDFGLAKELPPEEEGTRYLQACHCITTGYQPRCHSSPLAATLSKGSKGGTSTRTVFHLPGNTGTCRYMAPEVIRREAYNQQIDVYSFSIVLWELMSLQKPYGNDVSGNYVKECVAIYGDRPNILRQWKPHWPQQDAMAKILRQGWSRDITARPTMAEYQEELLCLVAASNSKVQSLQQQQQRLGLDDSCSRTCGGSSSSSARDQNPAQRQASF